MDTATTEETYRRRVEHFSGVERRHVDLERNVSRLRLALFFTAVAAFIAARNHPPGEVWNLLGGILTVGFVAAVVYHEYVRRLIARFRVLRQINEQGLARSRREWKALPERAVSLPAEGQSLADDLDLFGHASLFQLLSTANTPIGVETLRDWLLKPAAADEIPPRQQAASELAPRIELRQALDLEGRLLDDRGKAISRFLEWCERDPWLTDRPGLLWLFRAMSAAIPAVCLVIFAGWLSIDWGAAAILTLLFANVIATAVVGWWMHSLFDSVNLRYHETARYLRMFGLIGAMPAESAELQAIQGDAMRAGGGVLHGMRHLQRIVSLARIRNSAMLLILVYLPLQIVFLYDFHVLCLLEGWQKKYGRHARTWFAALGRLEALASLATLAHDNPGWAMPVVNGSDQHFRARELGHPLLPDGSRVANDVELGPPGSFLLVTGSNMSGKSTLLRAIGLNAVLAQAGAPVFAAGLTMPPMSLATSMRLHDSLEAGVSFYMAELLRLKQVVDLARSPESRDGRLLLYLLDEILMGTNSRERHIAVIRVMEHLLGSGAIGAISTHDLDLATSPPLASVCSCVHFRETLHSDAAGQTMTFDYRLRPGVATTSNALKLLEIVGLDAKE